MKFYRLSDATYYDRINTIYQFIKPFLDKKCLFLRNMEPLTSSPYTLFFFMKSIEIKFLATKFLYLSFTFMLKILHI